MTWTVTQVWFSQTSGKELFSSLLTGKQIARGPQPRALEARPGSPTFSNSMAAIFLSVAVMQTGLLPNPNGAVHIYWNGLN